MRRADDARSTRRRADRGGSGALRNLDELLCRVVTLVRPVDARVEPEARACRREQHDEDDGRESLHARSSSELAATGRWLSR